MISHGYIKQLKPSLLIDPEIKLQPADNDSPFLPSGCVLSIDNPTVKKVAEYLYDTNIINDRYPSSMFKFSHYEKNNEK